jgi:hypothetical protein
VGTTSQARAIKNYRKRLNQRGMARFEVLGLDADRELIRKLARKLAENGADAAEIRASLSEKVAPETRKKGSIYAVLRNWPLGDLNLTRPYTEGRKIDL